MAAWNELPADGGTAERDALMDVGDRLRWSAPELTVQFATRALGLATADQAARTRIQELLAAALVTLGRHTQAVEPAIAALRAATAGGQIERAARMRVALAACARAIGEPLTGCEVLRPVLHTKTAAPATRAFALGQLVTCATHVGGRDDLEDALAEADRLLASDQHLSQDARRVESALLNVRAAAYHRRHGDTEAAADTARVGLTLISRLHDPAAEGGRVRVRLLLELVCALLDEGDIEDAVQTAELALAEPARAAAAPALGRLCLALATRVHIPAGRTDAGRSLLIDAVRLAERHNLDWLLTDAWTFLAHADEDFDRPADALHALRSARAAEHRHLRAVELARHHLSNEFGLEQQPERAVAQLRTFVRTDTPARTHSAVRLPEQFPRRIPAEPPKSPAAKPVTFAVALVRVAPVGIAHPVDPVEEPVPVGGDVALNALASHVRDLAPDKAELLRTDLGEFAVLLPRTSHAEAERLATTIRDRAAESAWLVDDQGRDLTISTGVATQPSAGDSPRDGVDTLIAAARAALSQPVAPVVDLAPDGHTPPPARRSRHTRPAAHAPEPSRDSAAWPGDSAQPADDRLPKAMWPGEGPEPAAGSFPGDRPVFDDTRPSDGLWVGRGERSGFHDAPRPSDRLRPGDSLLPGAESSPEEPPRTSAFRLTEGTEDNPPSDRAAAPELIDDQPDPMASLLSMIANVARFDRIRESGVIRRDRTRIADSSPTASDPAEPDSSIAQPDAPGSDAQALLNRFGIESRGGGGRRRAPEDDLLPVSFTTGSRHADSTIPVVPEPDDIPEPPSGPDFPSPPEPNTPQPDEPEPPDPDARPTAASMLARLSALVSADSSALADTVMAEFSRPTQESDSTAVEHNTEALHRPPDAEPASPSGGSLVGGLLFGDKAGEDPSGRHATAELPAGAAAIAAFTGFAAAEAAIGGSTEAKKDDTSEPGLGAAAAFSGFAAAAAALGASPTEPADAPTSPADSTHDRSETARSIEAAFAGTRQDSASPDGGQVGGAGPDSATSDASFGTETHRPARSRSDATQEPARSGDDAVGGTWPGSLRSLGGEVRSSDAEFGRDSVRSGEVVSDGAARDSRSPDGGQVGGAAPDSAVLDASFGAETHRPARSRSDATREPVKPGDDAGGEWPGSLRSFGGAARRSDAEFGRDSVRSIEAVSGGAGQDSGSPDAGQVGGAAPDSAAFDASFGPDTYDLARSRSDATREPVKPGGDASGEWPGSLRSFGGAARSSDAEFGRDSVRSGEVVSGGAGRDSGLPDAGQVGGAAPDSATLDVSLGTETHRPSRSRSDATQEPARSGGDAGEWLGLRSLGGAARRSDAEFGRDSARSIEAVSGGAGQDSGSPDAGQVGGAGPDSATLDVSFGAEAHRPSRSRSDTSQESARPGDDARGEWLGLRSLGSEARSSDVGFGRDSASSDASQVGGAARDSAAFDASFSADTDGPTRSRSDATRKSARPGDDVGGQWPGSLSSLAGEARSSDAEFGRDSARSVQVASGGVGQDSASPDASRAGGAARDSAALDASFGTETHRPDSTQEPARPGDHAGGEWLGLRSLAGETRSLDAEFSRDSARSVEAVSGGARQDSAPSDAGRFGVGSGDSAVTDASSGAGIPDSARSRRDATRDSARSGDHAGDEWLALRARSSDAGFGRDSARSGEAASAGTRQDSASHDARQVDGAAPDSAMVSASDADTHDSARSRSDATRESAKPGDDAAGGVRPGSLHFGATTGSSDSGFDRDLTRPAEASGGVGQDSASPDADQSGVGAGDSAATDGSFGAGAPDSARSRTDATRESVGGARHGSSSSFGGSARSAEAVLGDDRQESESAADASHSVAGDSAARADGARDSARSIDAPRSGGELESPESGGGGESASPIDVAFGAAGQDWAASVADLVDSASRDSGGAVDAGVESVSSVEVASNDEGTGSTPSDAAPEIPTPDDQDAPPALPGPARSAAAAAWLRRTGRPAQDGEPAARRLTAVDGGRTTRKRERPSTGIAELLAEAMVAYQETQPKRDVEAASTWAADARAVDNDEPPRRRRTAPEEPANPRGRHRSSEWAPADIDHG